MASDNLIGLELNKLYNVKLLSRQYDYNEYIRVLSLLEMVITERYHTGVFSAIAHRPFILLNPFQLSKMHGIISLLDYPVNPIDTNYKGWADVVLKQVEFIFYQYEQITKNLNDAMPRVRKLAEENAYWDGQVNIV